MGNLTSKFQTNPDSSQKTERRSWCLTSAAIFKTNPVPLKSVNVDVRIEGFIANVRSTLVYKNTSKDPIEVCYEFPMDDQSVVYHFEAQIEDRIIVAECQEKEQAKETYDNALKQGYGAMLMKENDNASDIFSCLVGNLPPNADAIIKFGYVTELSLQPDGVLTFLLPTVLNPRYNPSFESGGWAITKYVTYVREGEKQPYTFEIKATVINPGRIINVNAAKDELNVKLSDDKSTAEVTLKKPFIANHGFTLDITYENIAKPCVIIEKGDESKEGILKKDIVMLNFSPALKSTDYTEKYEYIFVVDRSGSMQGSRVEMAKETLLLFLKSLPPGCYFNIVGFDSSHSFLFSGGSRKYSKNSLKEALRYQKSMDASIRGTRILEPLQDIYEKPTIEDYARQIFLLTDGAVSNTQAVIDLVKKNSNNTRVFAFGIGEGASTSLVRGVARAGRGKAEFTKEGERLQPLVIKTLKAAMQLTATELHLDWQLKGESTGLIQLPMELPPLFAGEKLIIYAMTSPDQGELEGKVNLKGNIDEHNFNFELEINSDNNSYSRDESLPIHRLAAKAQIKQLQDTDQDKNKQLIVLLSTAANVISCHTSMVGVDKNRKEKVTGDLFRQNIPVMRDAGVKRVSSLGMPMANSTGDLRSAGNLIRKNIPVMQYESVNKRNPVKHKNDEKRRLPKLSLMSSKPRSAPVSRSALKGLKSLTKHRTCTLGADYECDDVSYARGCHEDVYTRSESQSLHGEIVPKHGDDYVNNDKMLQSSGDALTTNDSTMMHTQNESTYTSIVSLQTFSGEWKLEKKIATVFKTSLDELKIAIPVKNLNIWATALALAFLEVEFLDKRDEWEIIERKARQWLDRQNREGYNVDDLLQKAKAIFIDA